MKTNSNISMQLVPKHLQTNSSLNYSAMTTEGKQKKKKRNVNSYKDIYLQKQGVSPNQSLQFKTQTVTYTINSQNDNSFVKGHDQSFRVNSQHNKRKDSHNLSIPNYSRSSSTVTPNLKRKGRKDNKSQSDDLLGEELSRVNHANDLFANKRMRVNKKEFGGSTVKGFKLGEDISEIRSDSYRKDTLDVEKERKDKEDLKGDVDVGGGKKDEAKQEKGDLNLRDTSKSEHVHYNVSGKANKSDKNIRLDNIELNTKDNVNKHNNSNESNEVKSNDIISSINETEQQILNNISNNTLTNDNNTNTSIINQNIKEQTTQNNMDNNINKQEQPNLHSPFIKSSSYIPTITEEPNSKNESYEEISIYEETEAENIDSKGNKTKSKQLIRTKKQIPKSQVNSTLQQQSLLKQKHFNMFTTPPHNKPTNQPEITTVTISNTLSPSTAQQLNQNSNVQATTSTRSSSHKYEYEHKQIPLHDNNGNVIGHTIKKYRKRKQSNSDIEIIEEIEEGDDGEVIVLNVIKRIKTTKTDSNGNIIQEYIDSITDTNNKENEPSSQHMSNNNKCDHSNTTNVIQGTSSPTQTHSQNKKRVFHHKAPSESQILYKSPNIHLQFTPSVIKQSASVRLYSPIQQYKIVHENELSTYSQPKIKSPLILAIIQNHFSINTANSNSSHHRALTEGNINIIPVQMNDTNVLKHVSPKQNDTSTTASQMHNLINDFHSKPNSNNKELSSYLDHIPKQRKSELNELQSKRDNIETEKRQRNEYKRTYHHSKNISSISIGTNNSLEKRLPQLLNDNIYHKELVTSMNTSISDMKMHSNQCHYKLTAPSRCITSNKLFHQRPQKEGYTNIATLRYKRFITERNKIAVHNNMGKEKLHHISSNNEYKTPFLSKVKADNLKYEIEKQIKLSCRNNPYETQKQTHQRNVFSQERIEPKSSFKNNYGIMPINSMNELYEMQYHYYFFKK